MARVLVLGGTGHIGSAIARQFALAGHEVLATCRHPGPRVNLEGTGIAISSGDDLIAGVIEYWMRQIAPDIVVDAATPYPVWLADSKEMDPNGPAVARVRRIIAASTAMRAKFILISSFTTLPSPRNGITNAILNRLQGYFKLKKNVEREVLLALAKGDLEGIVVNPATCLGPFDLKPQDQAFIPSLLAGKVHALTKHTINIVDVRDLAQCAFELAKSSAPLPPVPVFGHSLRVDALARRCCEMAGVKAPRFSTDALMGTAALYSLEATLAFTGRKTPWPSLPTMLVAASYAAEPSPEQLAHKGKPRPLDDTLADSIAWYQRLGRC
ncbi:NAD-dependent epimerase/dehydratase family protein [Sulfitobacter sp.]|uniref:NAD-dependent epimerase/dehydratase family protein n=1 Tax=Sulfitobacter sp. TaxID=1903071 RepID=UPI003001A382